MQVFRRPDIDLLGVSTVCEMIDNMTASTLSLSDSGGGNSFDSGASSASLRTLGKQSTLIYSIHAASRRPYTLADYNEVFTNLDTLPMEAIEGVEVLRSGGSAVCGSDAVAGVIKIITRKRYQGLSAHATHERSSSMSKLRQTNVSFTDGTGNLR